MINLKSGTRIEIFLKDIISDNRRIEVLNETNQSMSVLVSDSNNLLIKKGLFALFSSDSIVLCVDQKVPLFAKVDNIGIWVTDNINNLFELSQSNFINIEIKGE